MPKLNNRLPSYRLHKKSGQAVVTLNGKDHYLGPHGSKSSKQQYDRLISEWIANDRRTPEPPAAEGQHHLTIDEMILAYWGFAKTYYRKHGEPTKEQESLKTAFRPLRKLYGGMPAADFSPLKLKAVRDAFIEAGWCRSNINKHVGRVKRLFKWGVEHELVPPSVNHGLAAVAGLRKGRSAAKEAPPVKPVPLATVEATLPHLAPTVQAMVRIELLTGMRPGEVVIMRGRDLDMGEETWVYRPGTHKTEHWEKQRVIPLGPQAQEVLKPFLKPDVCAWLFTPKDAISQRTMQCGTHRRQRQMPNHKKTSRTINDRYDPTSYCRSIAHACDQAFPPPAELARHRVPGSGNHRSRWETVKEWRNRLGPKQWKALKAWQSDHRWFPNQLRHTRATQIRHRYGLEAARVTLGHSSTIVTEIYAERDEALAVQVAKEIG